VALGVVLAGGGAAGALLAAALDPLSLLAALGVLAGVAVDVVVEGFESPPDFLLEPPL
jgi:hypothetical protein